MAIYKSKHASNYTVLPNEVFKSKLSIEAIGLLAYFLSLPPDWVIYKTTLHTQLNIGRDKLNKVFDELRKSGYVISVEKRDGGKISYEHIVYDTPYNGEPSTDLPLTEKPSTVELPLLSTNLPSTNELNKNNKDILFEKFWSKYPNKVAKENCRKKFVKLPDKDIEKILSTLDTFVGYKMFEGYSHPLPMTYLNQKRWDDEIPKEKSAQQQQSINQINYKNLNP